MTRFATKLMLLLLSGCGLLWAGLLWTGPAWGANFEAGLDAFRAGNAEQARDVWTPLAEEGDAAAQYSLAKLYESGGGPVAQDLAQAVKWYEMAAAQGLPAAQNNLALMYAQGRGVETDAARAAALWHAAAVQDYPWGQYNLGLAYFRGHGVEDDRTEATAWFRKAADDELAAAQFIMGQLRREGIVVAQDHGQALSWYRRAAKQGHLDAMKQAQVLETAGVTPQPLEAPEVLPKSLAVAQPEPAAAPGETQAAGTAPAAALQNGGGAQSAPAPAAPDPEATAPEPPAEPEPVPLPAAKPAAVQPAAVQQAALTANDVASDGDAEPGAYRVWLASAGTEKEAQALWQATRARHPEIFTEADVLFARVDLGGGDVLFRILAGPMASEATAAELCQRLRAAQPSAFCKVHTN